MAESDARSILDARLASGEIGESEYDRLRARLDGTPPPPIETLPPPTKRFILVRLWNGELSLPVTYWVWGSGGGITVGLAAAGAMTFASTLPEILLIDGLILAWMIFIIGSIFASARAYGRRYPTRHWGTAAQIFAVLGFLSGLANLARALPGNESTYDLDQAIVDANKGLPRKIADNVRLDRVSRDGRAFIYSYTITGPTHVPSQSEKASVRDETVKAVCKDADTRRLLLSVAKTTYSYSNEAGKSLVSFDISSSDCN
jgi:hypothetical protein